MKKIILAFAIAASTLIAADGVELYKKCAACHGLNGEKKALNKSEVIGGWDSNKTIEALSGYKSGERDISGMGGLMKAQMAAFSEDDIKTVSDYIAELK